MVDIAIQGGRIESIASNLDHTPGTQVLDVEGCLVVPGFVDSHMHLDKAFALDTGLEPSDTLESAIKSFQRWSESASPNLIYENARRVAELALLYGTTALRTHVTVDWRVNMDWLDALVRVRDDMTPWLQMEIVVLPDAVLFESDRGREAVRGAIRRGADIVGGAPVFSSTPEAVIDAIYEIAGDLGCDIDIHADESDNPENKALEYLADRKLALGFEGTVTAGHCCSLSAMDEATAGRIIEKVVLAGINIITLPSCNLYLMGRRDKGIIRRGLTRVKELQAAGVNVAYATDNIRDAFTPFGKADMVQGALIAAHALQLGTPKEQELLLDMGTFNPARIMSLPDYGLETGCTASLVVLGAEDWSNVLARALPPGYVFSHGVMVARTMVDQKLMLS